MADDGWRERAEAATVRMLDAARRDYLQTTGASPLRQYEQLSNRARSAARTSATVAEWATALLRGLRIAAPSSWTSSALADLREAVAGRNDAFLALVESEWGLLIAEVQLTVQGRRETAHAEGRTTYRTGTPPAGHDPTTGEVF